VKCLHVGIDYQKPVKHEHLSLSHLNKRKEKRNVVEVGPVDRRISMFFTGKSPESELVDKCVENSDRGKKIFCKQSYLMWIILRIMI
jgi:hypothetical protein